MAPARTFTQADRAAMLAGDFGLLSVHTKRARIVAVLLAGPATVETDRGPMTAAAGDWLVTNHPDDDPGSDLWTISNDRMRSTYTAGQIVPEFDTEGGR